jgi:tetratricopeptide (TPR) repeat protein
MIRPRTSHRPGFHENAKGELRTARRWRRDRPSRLSILIFCVASCVAAARTDAAPEPPRASPDGGLEMVDHAARGRALLRSGQPAESVPEFRRALAVSPEDARTHHDLALALRALGDLAGAGKHFGRSLAIAPRCEVYADFGLLQDLLGREDLARESYEKAFALDAPCVAARMNLASMLIEDGMYEEAALHYGKAIEARPSAEAHSGLGFALNQLGRLDEAAAQHDAAVALDASLAEVHRNRALTQARLRNYEEAIVSYRRAVAIEPRVSAYYALAGVLRAAGRGDEAAAQYRRGQELSRRQQEQSPGAPAPSAGAPRAPEPVPTGGRSGMAK